MMTKPLRLLVLLALVYGLAAPASLIAADTSFRLIYIGALSGYVKLCG